MDYYGFALIILLVSVSGLIAYIGDKVGRHVGKRRISIFGLRPKHTSIIVTIVTGILIVSVTLCVLFAISKQARTAFFGLQKLLVELDRREADLKNLTAKYMAEETRLNASLARVRTDLAASGEALKESRASLEKKQEELDDILGDINLKTLDLSELQTSWEEISARVALLDAEHKKLLKKKRQLEADVRSLTLESASVLGDTKRDILFGEILYVKDQPLSRIVAHKGVEESKLKKLLLAMINDTFREAIELGARVDDEAYDVFEAQFKSLAGVLRDSSGDLIIEARSHTNVLIDQPIYITLNVVEDRLVFRDGQVIEKVIVAPGLSRDKISEILSDMLARTSIAARRIGMIPDPTTGRVGAIPARRFLKVTGILLNADKTSTVELFVAGDVHLSGRMNVDFRVK